MSYSHLAKTELIFIEEYFAIGLKGSNEQSVDIYFADPGTTSQRDLNENSNSSIRRNGLPKEMDFNLVTQEFISSVSSRRNNIPRKSLNYHTPIE